MALADEDAARRPAQPLRRGHGALDVHVGAAEVEQRRDRRARAVLVDDDEDRRSGDPRLPWHERDVDLHGRMSLLRAGADTPNAL